VKNLVDRITAKGAVAIIELVWTDYDHGLTEMPLRAANNTAGAVEFWESVAETFAQNDHVFFNLFRRPATSMDTYLDGTDQLVSMPEMVTAVRKHAKDNVMIIVGLNESREPESTKKIDKLLKASNESLVMYGVWASKPNSLQFDTTKYLERKVALMKYFDPLFGTDKPIMVYDFT